MFPLLSYQYFWFVPDAAVVQSRYQWKWIRQVRKLCCSHWHHVDISFHHQLRTTSGFRPTFWIYKCKNCQTWLAWVWQKNLQTKIIGMSSLAGTEPDILLGCNLPPPHLQHTLWETRLQQPGLGEMDKTMVIYVKFLHDVACQKLLKLVKVSWSYSKNNAGTDFSDTWCSIYWEGFNAITWQTNRWFCTMMSTLCHEV